MSKSVQRLGALIIAVFAAVFALTGCEDGYADSDKMSEVPTSQTTTEPTMQSVPTEACESGTITKKDDHRQKEVTLHLETCITLDLNDEGKPTVTVGTSDVVNRPVWLAVWFEREGDEPFNRHRLTICYLPAGERAESWFECNSDQYWDGYISDGTKVHAVATFELCNCTPNSFNGQKETEHVVESDGIIYRRS